MAYTEKRLKVQKQEGLLWWRVELDRDGSIKTCSEIEYASTPERYVRFIQASTRVEACSVAKEWWARRSSRSSACSQARRLELKVAGRCTRCRERPLCNATHCVRCRDIVNRRNRDLRAGAEREKKALDPVEAQARERASHLKFRESHPERYATLRFVAALKKFDELGPQKFREWLVERIESVKTSVAQSVPQAAE